MTRILQGIEENISALSWWVAYKRAIGAINGRVENVRLFEYQNKELLREGKRVRDFELDLQKFVQLCLIKERERAEKTETAYSVLEKEMGCDSP